MSTHREPPIQWHNGDDGRIIPVLRTHDVATARGEVSTIFEVSKQYADQMAKDLSDAYDDGPFGKQVTKFTAHELRQFRHLYTTVDGAGGGGLQASGEIAALYTRSKVSGTGERIVRVATADGGTYLECFDTFLPKIYQRAGMTSVARVRFQREFAPQGWDYDEMRRYAANGEPDIIFMIHSSQRHAERRFYDYDAAEAYTRRLSARHGAH